MRTHNEHVGNVSRQSDIRLIYTLHKYSDFLIERLVSLWGSLWLALANLWTVFMDHVVEKTIAHIIWEGVAHNK